MKLQRTCTKLALFFCFGISLLSLVWTNALGDDSLRDQQAAALRLLNGAIDMHFHMDPPASTSPGANIDNIRAARLLGVRGLVLKSHGESTAGLAYQLGLEMPDMTIFGGIVLNRSVGGINLAAVQRVASLKGHPGRVIWLPTRDSQAITKEDPGKPFVPLSSRGRLLSEVKELIAFIAKNNLVLATGHSLPEDALMVLKEGQAQGLKYMIVTHPMDGVGTMTMEQMRQAVEFGGVLELDFRKLVEQGGIDVIKMVGPEHVFISEFWTYQDLPPSPSPYRPIEYGGLEMVGRFVEAMNANGISDQDLDLMVKTNPARLLGLPVDF